MYLHLGNDIIISGEKVIAILNMENNISGELREIIENAQLDKKLINISTNDKQKAAVICDDRVYLSPISSQTLFKRTISYYKEV